MAFKTRRQTRYGNLRVAGFLPFEARELSRVPLKVPYMAMLIRDRYREARRAHDSGVSWAAFTRTIMQRYKNNDWIRPSRSGKFKHDPWKMLKDAEKRYRDRKPEYESPWEGRRRRWKDFLRQIEREYEGDYPKKKGKGKELRGATGDRWVE